ncbi:hypothetical protein [Pseudomonas phage vB_Pa-PAC1]
MSITPPSSNCGQLTRLLACCQLLLTGKARSVTVLERWRMVPGPSKR